MEGVECDKPSYCAVRLWVSSAGRTPSPAKTCTSTCTSTYLQFASRGERFFYAGRRCPKPRVLPGAAVFEHLPCVVGGSQTIQLKLQASILPNQQLTAAQVVLVPQVLELGFQNQCRRNAQTV